MLLDENYIFSLLLTCRNVASVRALENFTFSLQQFSTHMFVTCGVDDV
jgi:hypothetical protein